MNSTRWLIRYCNPNFEKHNPNFRVDHWLDNLPEVTWSVAPNERSVLRKLVASVDISSYTWRCHIPVLIFSTYNTLICCPPHFLKSIYPDISCIDYNFNECVLIIIPLTRPSAPEFRKICNMRQWPWRISGSRQVCIDWNFIYSGWGLKFNECLDNIWKKFKLKFRVRTYVLYLETGEPVRTAWNLHKVTLGTWYNVTMATNLSVQLWRVFCVVCGISFKIWILFLLLLILRHIIAWRKTCFMSLEGGWDDYFKINPLSITQMTPR